MNVRPRRALHTAAIAAILAVLVAGCSGAPADPARPVASAAASAIPAPAGQQPAPSATPEFDRTALSLDDPLSLWVVVDKLRPLRPATHVPPDLIAAAVPHISVPLMRPEAAHALELMFATASAEGAGALQVQNSYRSSVTQTSTYAYHVRTIGRKAADAQSARPGHSEHQTGLAVDIAALPSRCEIEECFGATPQGRWLAANAHRFGFLLSYPNGKTNVTGYIFEPWHFRYIGPALAEEMKRTQVTTLSEFFGLTPATAYAD